MLRYIQIQPLFFGLGCAMELYKFSYYYKNVGHQYVSNRQFKFMLHEDVIRRGT